MALYSIYTTESFIKYGTYDFNKNSVTNVSMLLDLSTQWWPLLLKTAKNRFYFKLASTECFIVAMAAYFSRPLWHTRQHINTLLPNLVALGAPSHWNIIIVFIEFIQFCNKQKIFHTDNDVHRIRVHSFVTLWTSKD